MLIACVPAARGGAEVFLEDLTWTEVRDRLRAGDTTVIVPSGGTEQNGPHMVLGKHNYRVRHAAGEIARRLGNALVAPVLAYVPEGGIDPPSGHMWAPGSISLPPDLFAGVLESAARGFAAQGFTDIVLIGDSGPNQAPMRSVAEALNREWAAGSARVWFVPAYYDAQGAPFEAWLRARGVPDAAIGTHAGLADTSLLLAVRPEGVRRDQLAPVAGAERRGVDGDPRGARAAYGRQGLSMAIEAAVAEIAALRARRRAP